MGTGEPTRQAGGKDDAGSGTTRNDARTSSPAKQAEDAVLRGVAGRAVKATLFAGSFLLFVVAAVVLALEITRIDPARSALFKVYADIFKTIVAGVVVALLAVLIPTLVGEARFAFERMKDSRVAYSNAKTGIDYLKLRLSTLNLHDAAALVQHVHFQKHLAELYDELSLHLLRRYKGEKTPRPGTMRCTKSCSWHGRRLSQKRLDGTLYGRISVSCC